MYRQRLYTTAGDHFTDVRLKLIDHQSWRTLHNCSSIILASFNVLYVYLSVCWRRSVYRKVIYTVTESSPLAMNGTLVKNRLTVFIYFYQIKTNFMYVRLIRCILLLFIANIFGLIKWLYINKLILYWLS
jgi:hypothetical protein